MKQNLHPTWYQCAVTCACGNTFTTGSVVESMQVDICSKCHPFFTGEMRFVDRQGRVDRFMQKMQAAQQAQTKSKKKSKTAEEQAADAKSYQQILREQQNVLRTTTKKAA